MGCGGSRLGGVAAARAEQGGVVPLPAGIRPLLRRRLEEMKKRSHASVLKGSQTQSKKELLRTGSSEDGEDTEENDGSLKSSAKVAPAPDHLVEEKKEVILEKVPSRDDVKEVKEEVVVKKQEDENKEVVKKQEEDIHHDDVTIDVKKEGDDGKNHDDVTINDKKEGDDGKNHDQDEESMSNFDERMIGPASPSFRVYCIDVPSDDDDEVFAEKDGEEIRKSMENESVTTELKEDESIVKKEKRERRGKRFGMGLPKKYLANVTAPCYAGGGCMGNTRYRLVQEKSSQ